MMVEVDKDKLLVNVIGDKASEADKSAQRDQVATVKEVVANIANRWLAAETLMADAKSAVAERPDYKNKEAELLASQQRGRDLFYGSVANCIKCHGDSALGDGNTVDYDDWVKDLYDPAKAPQKRAEFVALGLLPPRNIRPRNLRLGVYRGGLRPIDIYWRIKNGIEGTPMPAATIKPEGDPNAKGLVPSDIWDLVNYVQSLPYEAVNDPWKATPAQAENLRQLP
jgi:mono/diheme cytochrome c family protein